MAHQDRKKVIEDAFEDPKRATNDMGSYEEHPLPDLISADKYLKDTDVGKATGTKKRFLGVMLRKIGFPGTVH